MSYQYDYSREGYFEIDGNEYHVIYPSNAEELAEGFYVSSLLETYADDSNGFYDLYQEQEEYIQAYIEELGEFDSTNISANISFLCKQSGLKIGQLEDSLKISAGYISRTIKEKSKKKMSVDIAWKIARLFKTDINTLTESQMWISHTNTDLLEKFIDRLYDDTKNGKLSWVNDGGCDSVINERYLNIELFTEENDGKIAYHPNYLAPEKRCLLDKDIISLKCFDGKKDLVIIPYKIVGMTHLKSYDYIFVWKQDKRWLWEKVFSTNEDLLGKLVVQSGKLYQLVESAACDVKLTLNMQRMIKKYMSEGELNDKKSNS